MKKYRVALPMYATVYITTKAENEEELFPEDSIQVWSYRWEDGWSLSISGQRRDEKKFRTDGFNGRSYMIDEIILYGKITNRKKGEPI